MRAARYDQVYLVPVAHINAGTVRNAGANREILDLEFGNQYRSSRLPAGWFIRPSALVVLVCMFIL